ncbi:PREDICTED: probable serine/threonine-protein kinase DDB_G0282963 isoform X2 [Camelina sativa]|uniref:Probable serine/threonine-protein kinase DDB_G0282963 isoform X2 n=1 Tax=Camelina sativa TaxID=90675 RepID=A0ABM0Y0C2_CAMSA|nr:PREDICTED: probable serine/threonine-protein kinase DDB_G0282963 isoform X2 [Camelina sativa]
MILQSPKVAFYRRSKTIKGKRMPSSCKEKDQVKEEPVGYNDALISILPSFPGIKKLQKKWSSEEDEEIIAAVKRHGEGSWALIAKEEFEGERTPSQLSQRAIFVVTELWYGSEIVAIKVVHRGTKPDEKSSLESHFIREVNMMSRVQHPNLVKFIGACKDPLMVIVTELLPRLSLRKYLATIRPQVLRLPLAFVLCP